MVATLSQSQAELPRLVEIASQGEEVLITVNGQPKAKLIKVDSAQPGTTKDVNAWLKELEEVRRKFATNKNGASVDQILESDRAESEHRISCNG